MQVSNFVPTVNEAAATYKGKRKVNSVGKRKRKKQEDISTCPRPPRTRWRYDPQVYLLIYALFCLKMFGS